MRDFTGAQVENNQDDWGIRKKRNNCFLYHIRRIGCKA